ncbi:MAG TPA: cytochrome c peroxidase [Blastocatellia bacterium]|jgi:cytochrome c peroxidase
MKALKLFFATTGMLLSLSALFIAASPSAYTNRKPSLVPTFAAVSFAPVAGEIERNKERLAKLILEASQRGARFVVVPELGLTGPLNNPRNEKQIDALVEPVPGPTTDYFAGYARKLNLSLAISVLEKQNNASGYFLTTVLLNEKGDIVNKYRKILPRLNREDGPATRGNYRDIIDTVDMGRLRLGVISGDDIQVGVPRLAERGADTILISAGWNERDTFSWDNLCRQLSAQYSVNLVVANRPTVEERQSGEAPGLSRIYLAEGKSLDTEKRDGAELVVASLPRRALAWQIDSALGLPSVPLPSNQPPSAEIAELGRAIFFDKGLSSTGTISCASCHHPDKAFTNGLEKGVGVMGRQTKRNVPTLLDVAFRPVLQWDGYATSLESFVKYPISGYTEMDFHYLDKVEAYVRSRPDYVKSFRSAMGVDEARFDDVERALATYMRTLISGNSPFDRYYYGGEKSALSESARRGLKLFTGKADCAKCHVIGERFALFMDLKYHNLGVGFNQAEKTYSDIGLGAISTNDLAGYFLTPPLRNIAETAPYMHDGSLKTLEEVIDFHTRGRAASADQSRKAPLADDEIRDLVAFLRSLSGDCRYDSQGRRLK